MRKIIVDLLDTGAIGKVEFIGDHVTNRELERVLKAIKQHRKQIIREYRKQQTLKRITEEQKNDSRKQESIGTGSDRTRTEGTTGKSEPAKPAESKSEPEQGSSTNTSRVNVAG